jgi:hypothetical protein
MSANSGGPAFPLQSIGPEFSPGYAGMTLRDYFAAKAMQAVPMAQSHLHDIPAAYERIAQHAYKMADAMLATRGK